MWMLSKYKSSFGAVDRSAFTTCVNRIQNMSQIVARSAQIRSLHGLEKFSLLSIL